MTAPGGARAAWRKAGVFDTRGAFPAVEPRGVGAAPGATGFTCSLISGRLSWGDGRGWGEVRGGGGGLSGLAGMGQCPVRGGVGTAAPGLARGSWAPYFGLGTPSYFCSFCSPHCDTSFLPLTPRRGL